MSDQPALGDSSPYFGAYFNAQSDQTEAAIRMAPYDGQDDRQKLKRGVHLRVCQELHPGELANYTPEDQRTRVRDLIEQLIDLEPTTLNSLERRDLVQELLDDILGLGPLEKLLRDASIDDILVNGPNQIFVERSGVLKQVAVRFRDSDHLLEVIRRILSQIGRRVDEMSPIADARLADGSRVNAIIPPLAVKGPTLSIRRFGSNVMGLEDLLHHASLAPEMATFLKAAVRAKFNVLISGGTGSGKTTLLNALSGFIPATERIVTIEDCLELQLQQHHVVQLEARPANIEGKGQIPIRILLRNSLRMRPDRIVIGECRGAEALDMLQAMNTGHDGSLTTLHANSPRDALTRLEMMVTMSGFDIPLHALRDQMGSAIHLIVQIERLAGGPRKITSIAEITGTDQGVILSQELFNFRQLGLDGVGKAYGQFEATGMAPQLLPSLQAAGEHLPQDLFNKRVLLEA